MTIMTDANPATPGGGTPTDGRRCCRCDRVFFGKAGRMVAGKPACPPCGNALRPAVACGSCGRMTKRPGRSPDHDGLVCETCRLAGTHATCRVCRRHRRVARRSGDGRPLCAACALDVPATHPCPTCGEATPGNGAARCPRCALADRIERRVAAEAATIGPPWARNLFHDFCAWEGLPKANGAMTRRIAAHASLFCVLGDTFAGAESITQEALLASFAAEGLRRSFHAVRYLVERLALPWETMVAETSIEHGRTTARMSATAAEPWASDLDAYRVHLAAAKPIRPKTLRGYVAAAAGLLTHARVGAAEALTDGHVTRYLRRRPGQSANLMRFLSWVSDQSGQRFERRKRKRRTPPRRREKETLRKAARLLGKLAQARDPRHGRAVLAATIVVLHHLPLTKVLTLHPREASLRNGCVVLWPAGDAIELTEPLAAAFVSFTAADGPFAFPGRNAVQALTSSAVRHHVRCSSP